MYVAAAETCELPIAPMGRWLTCLNRLSSIRDMYVPATPAKLHRPYGKLTFCSLLAGRWCRSLWRHSDHLFVHHQWEYSFFCARSSSKVPNAPMGKMLMCLPRLTLAQLRTIRSTAVGECCRDLENFPSPRWECLADMQFDSRRSNGIKSCSTRDGYVPALPPHRPHARLTV